MTGGPTFLSYAHEDAEVCTVLTEALGRAQVAIFRDREALLAGERWPVRIGEAIEQCERFILLYSRHAAASNVVELEWTAALARKRPIVPVLLDDTALPALLAGLHHLELQDAADAAVVASQIAGSASGLPERRRSSHLRRAALVLAGLLVASIVVVLALRNDGRAPGKLEAARTDAAVAQVERRDGSIAGVITEYGDPRHPLEGVTVKIREWGVSAVTDKDGHYVISPPGGAPPDNRVRLQASHPDYEADPEWVRVGDVDKNFAIHRKGKR